MTRNDALIAAATALTRLAFWRMSGTPGTHVYTWFLSDGWLRHGTLAYGDRPTAAFEPLYPLFIAAARWLVDSPSFVIAAQIGIACAGAICLGRLARIMSGRADAALGAGLAYAAYPYLIRQSATFMEITLLSTLLLGAWLAWASGRRYFTIVLLTLAVLTRATLLPATLFCLLLMFRRGGWRSGLAASAIVAAFITPVVVRTYRLEGAWAPTRQGENLYVGNNPYAAQMIPRYDLDLLPPVGEARARERLGVGPDAEIPPAVLDRELTREAWDYLKADPWRAVKAKAMNLLYFFDPRIVPLEGLSDDTTFSATPEGRVVVEHARQRPLWQSAAHTALYSAVLIMALAGAWRRRQAGRAEDLDALLFVTLVTLALISAVYFPTTRMRAPLDPMLMAYAACAFRAGSSRS
ncbi:MAG: hypothetical protein EPO35_07715 [Acidobacteria bacterium]|nr:MAG: hypothetical protein EPO35_07715 [Acidobacteriota bacterium]